MSGLTLIPTTNIREVNVRDTLNANGGNVSDTWASLCGGDGINPWSKHKPVRKNVNFCQDHTQGAMNYLARWWIGYNELCGFNLDTAVAHGWSELRSKYDGAMNGWVYEPPTGGVQAPYRITDFAGYYPSAQPLTQGFSAPNIVYTNDTTATAMMSVGIENEHSLTWADFPTLSSYYFGVLIYRSDSDYRRVTSTTTLGAGGTEATFDPSTLTVGGQYSIYPFLCSHQIAQNDTDPSGLILYTCPNVNPVICMVERSEITISATAQKTNATQTVTWSVTVRNAGTYATLYNNNVRIYRRFATEVESGEANINLGTFSINAGATMTVGSGTASLNFGTSEEEFATLQLQMDVTLGGGTYEYSIMVANDLVVDPPKQEA